MPTLLTPEGNTLLTQSGKIKLLLSDLFTIISFHPWLAAYVMLGVERNYLTTTFRNSL